MLVNWIAIVLILHSKQAVWRVFSNLAIKLTLKRKGKCSAGATNALRTRRSVRWWRLKARKLMINKSNLAWLRVISRIVRQWPCLSLCQKRGEVLVSNKTGRSTWIPSRSDIWVSGKITSVQVSSKSMKLRSLIRCLFKVLWRVQIKVFSRLMIMSNNALS